MTKELALDMSDPAVQRMLGGDDSRLATGKRPSMVQLAGDAPDPTMMSDRRGIQSTHRLDGAKIEVHVVYQGRHGVHQMTCDLYALPGEATRVMYICPKCRHCGTISSERKKIEYDPGRVRNVYWEDYQRVLPNGGELCIEPFECSFEMPDAGEHVVGLRSGGITLCKCKLVIENNVARDA